VPAFHQVLQSKAIELPLKLFGSRMF